MSPTRVICGFRGIGKPPDPPQCTQTAGMPESDYCDDHRCVWHDPLEPRCPEPRDPAVEDTQWCRQHSELVQLIDATRHSNEQVRLVGHPELQITGLGPDAPTVTEANGAKQSHAPYAFTSIDPMVLFEVARVQRAGDDKYGPDNWRRLPEKDHINHALAHIYAHQLGDLTDDHLSHAVVRMMFALAVHLRPDFHGEDARDDG